MSFLELLLNIMLPLPLRIHHPLLVSVSVVIPAILVSLDLQATPINCALCLFIVHQFLPPKIMEDRSFEKIIHFPIERNANTW